MAQSKKDISNLKTFLKTKLDRRVNAIKKAVSAFGASFDEPASKQTEVVDADTVIRQVFDKNNKDAYLEQITIKDGKVIRTLDFTSGSFDEDDSEGDRINHVKKNLYVIVEGDSCYLVVGKFIKKINGAANLEITGATKFKLGGSLEIDNGSTNIKVSGGNIDIKCSAATIKDGNVTVDGGKVTITGVQPGATPGFCQLPVCAFTGAPHTGKTA